MSLHCACNMIRGNPDHALEVALPRVHVPARLTLQVVSVHLSYIDVPRSQKIGSFVPSSAHAKLNSLN